MKLRRVPIDFGLSKNSSMNRSRPLHDSEYSVSPLRHLAHDEKIVGADEFVGGIVAGEGLGVGQIRRPAVVGPNLVGLGRTALGGLVGRVFAGHAVRRDDEVLARLACHHSHEITVSSESLNIPADRQLTAMFPSAFVLIVGYEYSIGS